ncbi:putative membrane protein [Chitinophaga dinghuensis]|uniref:Putative membrane protein n=1 Tax=Chitinophaga dinghuensis TaxID=1539050 RepID=A0A327VQ15_9BACT|nr:DUF1361 domain-containing protein [Chitinophaga dinghuensis]RAJ75519.1 putative membrane protein [Chitinophaga dinghuensis]
MKRVNAIFRKLVWMIENPGLLPVLCVSVLFSLAMILFRVYHTGSMLRLSLVWNLFLALVPFAITIWMERHPVEMRHRLKWYSCFVVWLLFIPNAPYILTDLFHLYDGGISVWFELILILSFGWNGLIMGYLSIRSMERMWKQRYSRWPAWLFTFPVMFLCGMGVYIGRYLRWNSWDVLQDPIPLAKDLLVLVLHPWENRSAWAFTLLMGIFLSLGYMTTRNPNVLSGRRYRL